ncbi:MAG: hypothetical protein JXR12_15315 [Neptunomonas phycophila]|uniref:hypothetical protein n=1 Tax=Neptunomonas phycophila TaxID=1572645 RepID=UPI003B8BEA8F
MTKTFKKLTVADRNAVIDSLGISDETAARELNITVEEVATARTEVAATAGFDATPYKAHFQKPTTADSGSATAIERPKKKRGPSGTRIVTAFDAVTTEPVSLAEHAKKYHVSENCLRQPKRFYSREGVVIRVRKKDGVQCIWREAVESDEASTPAATA